MNKKVNNLITYIEWVQTKEFEPREKWLIKREIIKTIKEIEIESIIKKAKRIERKKENK